MTNLVGIRRSDGSVQVGVQPAGGTSVSILTSLEEFWRDPQRWVSELRTADAEVVDLSNADVTLVPPVLPGARVICIGLNYLRHLAEGSYAKEPLPEHPTLFARWSTSLTVAGVGIPVPDGEDGLDWEGEVVAWVGTRLVDATPEAALASVLGYSAFNDVTSRKAQKLTSQWILGKNGDNSGPLGPLVPANEVGDLRDGLDVVTSVNGTEVQRGSTSEMVYSVGDTLSLISHTFTLEPGDLLATGTPSGVGYSRTPPWLMVPGDEVTVEVERVGSVTNPIVSNREGRLGSVDE